MHTATLAIACLVLSWSAWAQSKPADTPAAKMPQGTVTAPSTTTKPGTTKAPERADRATTAAPLTEAECHGLGGQTGSVSRCASGRVCVRADQDGVIHQACITAK
jgi:hypothetical protein